MVALLNETAALISPLIGAGTVLFFMRRDRAAFDARLEELKLAQREASESLGTRLERIETNQHRFELGLELGLKDCATRDQHSCMDTRVDALDRRLAVLEEKCRTAISSPRGDTGMGGHA